MIYQKGQIPVLVLIGIMVAFVIILFLPIPYYVAEDQVVCLGIDICPKHGWNLGPPLWQRIFGYLLFRE